MMYQSATVPRTSEHPYMAEFEGERGPDNSERTSWIKMPTLKPHMPAILKRFLILQHLYLGICKY